MKSRTAVPVWMARSQVSPGAVLYSWGKLAPKVQKIISPSAHYSLELTEVKVSV